MNANYDLCSSMLSLKVLRISGIVMRSTYIEQKDHTTRHRQVYGRPFVSKLWHDIRAVFSPRILAIIPATPYTWVFFATYTCVLSCFVRFLFPSIWPFSYKRAYICAQKSPYICVTNKDVVYGVTESRRIRGTELYRQQKSPSCTMELKSNVSLNQAWPQWPR